MKPIFTFVAHRRIAKFSDNQPMSADNSYEDREHKHSENELGQAGPAGLRQFRHLCSPHLSRCPKFTIAHYSSPVRGAHRTLSDAWQKLSLGLVRCLCPHAQLRAHLRIERCVAWRGVRGPGLVPVGQLNLSAASFARLAFAPFSRLAAAERALLDALRRRI